MYEPILVSIAHVSESRWVRRGQLLQSNKPQYLIKNELISNLIVIQVEAVESVLLRETSTH